jgi:hypothetical protein
MKIWRVKTVKSLAENERKGLDPSYFVPFSEPAIDGIKNFVKGWYYQ